MKGEVRRWLGALCLVAACGQQPVATDSSESSSPGSPSAEKELDDAAAPLTSAHTPVKPVQPGTELHRIIGRATVSTPEQPEQTGAVRLSAISEQAIEGTLVLDGVTYFAAGRRQQNAVRCWLHAPHANPDRVRRGALWGTVTNHSVQGAFAISGNGGTDPIQGTWTAELKR